MLRFIFLSITLLFALACSSDLPSCESCAFDCLDGTEADVYTNACLDNWECTYEVFSESKIDADNGFAIVNGSNIVFRMNANTQGVEEISDDEVSELLVLEIDSELTSFNLQNDQLKDAKVSFLRSCFCAEVEYKIVEIGCLQAERQENGSWFIQANLTIPDQGLDRVVMVDALFE